MSLYLEEYCIVPLSRAKTCRGPLTGFEQYTIELCKKACSRNDECTYFTQNDSGYCSLYADCDPLNLRTPAVEGDTYTNFCPVGDEWPVLSNFEFFYGCPN